jgi:hypothetical protein
LTHAHFCQRKKPILIHVDKNTLWRHFPFPVALSFYLSHFSFKGKLTMRRTYPGIHCLYFTFLDTLYHHFSTQVKSPEK